MARQPSFGSGERMNSDTFEIRAATCCIGDRAAFLHTMREISEEFGSHIICFNADLVAGRPHVESAVRHAIRSVSCGTSISKTLEMESLLYAAGSRQTSIGAEFGIHAGENRMYVCCHPAKPGIWKALSGLMDFCADEDPWGVIEGKKKQVLMDRFSITEGELGTTLDGDLVPLVLERVALLDVNK